MKSSAKQSAPKDIPVVIFCGGRGSRLKEETEVIPKPLVPIAGRPILWHIMKIYYAQGFRHFILLLGYKGEQIESYARNHLRRSSERWTITCLDTGLDTQTGGRLKQAQKLITSPIFMLTYGDGVADVNLRKLLAFHQKEKRTATMTAVHPPVRFGEVVFNGNDVVAFREKPDPKRHRSEHLINGGFFVLDAEIFNHMSSDSQLVFERDVLSRLAKRRHLAALPHRGYWQCMDTIRDKEVLNEAWGSGKAPWKLWD